MAVKLPGEAEALPVARAPTTIVSAPKDQLSSAIYDVGRAMAGAGHEMQQAFDEEKRRVDKVRAEDAFTELRNAQIDLTIGEENGFRNLKSGDAVKRPLLKEWSDRFDTTAADINSRLENDEQRTAFRLRADVAKSQFSQDILNHLATENKTYRTQVMDATVQTETNAASINWNNPTDAMASLERIRRAYDVYADANGLTGKVKQAGLQKQVSVLHAAVIGQAMNNGNVEYANLWYKTHRKEIDPATAAHLEKLMSENGTRIKAQQAVDSIMMMGKDETAAKDYARKKFTGEMRDDVIKRIEARYQDARQGQAQAYKEAEDDAWKVAVKPGSSLDSIPPTLWSSMSGESQKQLTDYFRVRDQREKKEDDWAMLDVVEHKINVGDITETSDLLRYEPYFKDSTLRSLRNKVDKRGTVSATVVQRAFEDRLGKTRSKWKDRDREQWMAFQGYILDNVKETKRPEDVDAWADKWFKEGYGSEDRLLRDDPNTFGEAFAKGRKDFVIKTPEEAQVEVGTALELLRKGGVKIPTTDDAMDQFYTQHYLDASRWFAARDIVASPDRIAAYAALKSRGMPVTEANIDHIARQMR